jgi:hypothetical protein
VERALRALPPAGGSGGGGPGRRAAGGPGGGGPLRRRGPVAARHISTSAGHCLPRRLERRCRAAAGGWEERVGRFRRRRPAAGGRRRAVPGEWRDEPPSGGGGGSPPAGAAPGWAQPRWCGAVAARRSAFPPRRAAGIGPGPEDSRPRTVTAAAAAGRSTQAEGSGVGRRLRCRCRRCPPPRRSSPPLSEGVQHSPAGGTGRAGWPRAGCEVLPTPLQVQDLIMICPNTRDHNLHLRLIHGIYQRRGGRAVAARLHPGPCCGVGARVGRGPCANLTGGPGACRPCGDPALQTRQPAAGYSTMCPASCCPRNHLHPGTTDYRESATTRCTPFIMLSFPPPSTGRFSLAE